MIGASAWLRDNGALTGEAREASILAALRGGSIPGWLFDFRSVIARIVGADGSVVHEAQFSVAPDYLCLGNDTDFMRIPMWPGTAQAILGEHGWSLPTKSLVDQIWRQADVRLDPQPIPASPFMVTTQAYAQHHGMIETQLSAKAPGFPRSALKVGQKKDVILGADPGFVLIYGWHQSNGQPIQGLSGHAHNDQYVDYSHGIRPISNRVMLDGQSVELKDIIANPILSSLVGGTVATTAPGPVPRSSALPGKGSVIPALAATAIVGAASGLAWLAGNRWRLPSWIGG